jgi:hypothetical protein
LIGGVRLLPTSNRPALASSPPALDEVGRKIAETRPQGTQQCGDNDDEDQRDLPNASGKNGEGDVNGVMEQQVKANQEDGKRS